jgi:hypothetical protein
VLSALTCRAIRFAGISQRVPEAAVHLLLEKGADPGMITHAEQTSPLVIATANAIGGAQSNLCLVEMLLDAGAAIDASAREAMQALPWFHTLVSKHLRWQRRALWLASLKL